MGKITVDEYILKSAKWEEILILLRELILACGYQENVKWGMPTYTINGKNVVGLVAFKSYAGLWFYQGVFLNDKAKLLYQADESSNAMRQWRFKNLEEAREQIETILEYLEEAAENQRQGKVVKPNLNKPIIIPTELKQAFDSDPGLKQRFSQFSKSDRRMFAAYIDQAKRQETRDRRLKKVEELIRNGRGLMD